MGGGADRRGSGQRSGPTPRRVGRQLTPAKRHAQNGKLGQKTAVDIKKGGIVPPFLWFFAVFCRALVVLRRALEVVSLAFGTIRPQCVVGAASGALDD